MRRRELPSTRLLLVIVIAVGAIVIYNSARQSAHYEARRSISYSQVTTVTTQVRLLESREAALESLPPVHRVYSSFQPPTELNCTETSPVEKSKLNRRSVVDLALSTRAAIAGFHNKSGLLAPVQWRPEYKKKRNDDMSVWFAYPHKKHSACMSVQPPLQYPGCVVTINHHYKYIWIKGKRVGSTVMREPLGWICGDNWLVPKTANRTYCSEQLQLNTEMPLEAVQQYWDDYFVFSFIRNPYSRFASGYSYVDSLMGDCPHLVTFGKLCDSPFLLAKMCSVLGCCWSGAVTHHISHAMEQQSCLFTEHGELAVDFIGEMENLSEDLHTVLDEINRRRSPDLPPLRIEDAILPKINSQGDQYIRNLFISNTTCLDRIERNYWADFKRLGYDRVTASVQ